MDAFVLKAPVTIQYSGKIKKIASTIRMTSEMTLYGVIFLIPEFSIVTPHFSLANRNCSADSTAMKIASTTPIAFAYP